MEILVAAALLVSSLVFFFRDDVESGLALVLGDHFDGTIELALLEHWSNVLRGFGRWNRPDFFYPVPDTLGYNDGYLFTGMIFTAWRAAGAGLYAASEATNAVVKSIGFTGFVLFAVVVLRCRLWISSAGAFVFTAALNSYLQSGHVQLFTVAFAPVAGVLLAMMVRSILSGSRSTALAYGVSGALFMAGWLLTAFYTAWFFMFYATLVMTLSLIAFRDRMTAAAARACALPVAASMATFAVATVPFLLVYLPKASETGMHHFDEVFGYLSTPVDILNLRNASPLYRTFQTVLMPLFSGGGEHAAGLTPFSILMFLVATTLAARHARRERCRFLLCMGLAAILFWCASIRFGTFTVWHLVYEVVPGAQGIRVISRVPLLLEWPVITAAVVLVDDLDRRAPRHGRHRTGPAVVTLVLALLMAEQYTPDRPITVNRVTETAWLRAIPRPPGDCRSFFVSRDREADPIFGRRLSDLVGHDISAMLLAEWFRLPTINGFATFVPAGWSLLAADREDYPARVHAYAADHHVEGICGLDLLVKQWNDRPFQAPPAPAPASTADP